MPRGSAHAKERPRGVEPAGLQPLGELVVTVVRIDDDRPPGRLAEGRAHEQPRGLIVGRDHRTDLVEQAPWAPETVLDADVRVDHVRVVRGAEERPFEQDPPVGAEDPIVLRDHRPEIDGSQAANGPRREVAARVAGEPGRLGDMTRQLGLVLETVSLVERTSQRRGVEPDRDLRRHGAQRFFQQPPADSLAAPGRIHEHHRNPAERAVVDADRGADDPVVRNRGKAAGRRELQEHAPVGPALIPAGAGAQPERAVEIG